MKWLFALVVPAVFAVDLSSMLQVEVASSAEFGMAIDNIESQISNLNIPGQANRLAINALMKTLAKSDRLLDDATIATLRQVVEILQNTSEVFIRDQLSRQEDMNASIAATTACNTAWVHHVAEQQQQFDNDQGQMDSCRIEQQRLTEMRDLACNHAMDHSRAQNPSCEFDDGPYIIRDPHTQIINVDATKLIFQHWMDEINTARSWFQNKVAQVVPKWVKCQSYVIQVNTQQGDCHDFQANADAQYCIWKHATEYMCSKRTTCIASALENHNADWARLSALATTSAKEACFIKHVICLVNKLIEGSTDVNACDDTGLGHWETQCAQYLIQEPAKPEEAFCDQSDIAQTVGTHAYYVAHYTNFANYSTIDNSLALKECPSNPSDLSDSDMFPPP